MRMRGGGGMVGKVRSELGWRGKLRGKIIEWDKHGDRVQTIPATYVGECLD
jgi:hypothetical protein